MDLVLIRGDKEISHCLSFTRGWGAISNYRLDGDSEIDESSWKLKW